MIRRQRRARKGKTLKICPGGSWLLRPSTSISPTTLSSSSDRWCSSLGKTKALSYWLKAQRWSILRQFMDMLHSFRLIHLHRMGSALVWILMQGYTTAPALHHGGLLIWKTILEPSIGASSSSSSGATPDRDSLEDYPKIGANACWNPAIEAHCINMVGPDRGDSQNSSSKYPTIGGSEASCTDPQQQYCSESKSGH
jgi:hypothetical protein